MSDPFIELIARGVFIHQHRLLVCRGKLGHEFLPGGHVEFGERAGEALVREMREELGIELLVAGFLGACEARFNQTRKSGQIRSHHEVNLLFRLESPQGSAFDPATVVSQEEHIDFRWVSLDKVPGSTLLPVGIAALIVPAGSAGSDGPGWVSVFDSRDET